MYTAHIDLGQIIIGVLVGVVGIVGWFIKKEIVTFGQRLDKNETAIFNMAQQVSTAVGQIGIIMKLYERRLEDK